ncbi:MAG: 16S rRNA (adenine(1518)-N(6)/adenine(1519)-N(6))-dimethyltransferase RsmA [Candidatus Omnitrophota bacterium]|jgi:16S rRNA (adenine1518-N6/adenine1519-N6)-dimethyltransferase
MHIKPKKSLGQNFLIDRNIGDKIVNSCGLHPDDIVFEIGAGRGELTRLIAQKVKLVYALEIDKRLYENLVQEFEGRANVKFINADILKFNLKKIKAGSIKIKVVGNIPYYISSPIIEHLFQYSEMISDIFLTVQKEFAERASSLPGTKKYGSFSCFVRYYSQPEILFNISRSCFRPEPEVASAFLHLSLRETAPVQVDDENALFKIIRAAFNKRRKTLRNSLEGVVGEGVLNEFFVSKNLDKNTRPERLSLEDFADILNLTAAELRYPTS